MNIHPPEGDIIFVSTGRELCFSRPLKAISAHRVEEVQERIEEVASEVAAGMYAAGYVAYEAAPGFDSALVTHPSGELPLLYFALYPDPPATATDVTELKAFSVGDWHAGVTQEAYRQAIARLRELIAAGDTYQVNYTFPMTTAFSGDAMSWFRSLCFSQRTDHAAFINLGRFKILSVSPELFFRLDGDRLETRPMKGTRPRGRWPREDRQLARELLASEKERAENLMIVDLLRNDMGRISEVNSVCVPRLFEVERYETVWQMTSTITSKTQASVPEIFAALFPSGSVTGAPKVRAMQIIRDLEGFPRGVYCGAIGWWAPGRSAEFNVAIRTATIDTQEATARYHVGGGITWDSSAEAEFDECRVKAVVVTTPRPRFELLETLLFDQGYFLLDDHLRRMAESAEYFGFVFDSAAARARLEERASAFSDVPTKVRLLVKRDGTIRMEHAPITPPGPVRLALAAQPVDDRDVFLYHKTTQRTVYKNVRSFDTGCTDVILWNQRGELTETTIANLALNIDGEWLTPPVSSGLLAGVMRGRLLREGKLREAVLHKDDLQRASTVAIFNSVRKWIDVTEFKI